jgi:hypothetical protein
MNVNMATGAPQIGVVTPSVAASQPGSNGPKYWIFMSILCLAFATSACGAGAQSTSVHKKMDELRSENARLEAQLTELSEQKLQAERNGCAEPAAKPQKVTSLPAETEETSLLPVVKMGPEDLAQGDEGPVTSVRPAQPVEEEDDIPVGMRPVLKVRGQHEAWVYHRPVSDSDSETSPGAAPPSPSSSD